MAETLAERLVTANRIVANEGIVDAFGHVSAREPGGETMLISRSISPALVTEDDLLRVTLDGEVIDDERDTYLEDVIHRAIYRNREDVNAVVHHHAPEIVPFASTDVEYRPVSHQGLSFRGGVPKFGEYGEEYGLLVATEEEGERMARNLGDARAQLLEGHGANVVGTGLREAIVSTVQFVNNARDQLAAMGVGEITFEPPDGGGVETTGSTSEAAVERLWTYLTRRLDR